VARLFHFVPFGCGEWSQYTYEVHVIDNLTAGMFANCGGIQLKFQNKERWLRASLWMCEGPRGAQYGNQQVKVEVGKDED